MDIKELMCIQSEFDKEHGWSLEGRGPSELLAWLHKDLVGLFGELGEFANDLKKITLKHEIRDMKSDIKTFQKLKGALSEELIDAFIYLMRIAVHLEIDVEREYIKKLKSNRRKYKQFRR